MRRGIAFGLALVFGLGSSTFGTARADDDDFGIPYRATPAQGVDCEGDVVKTFDSVWLGHFTGGYSHSLGPGEPIVLDWRDEKLCFPSKRACDRHMSVMRRQFHRPEGYFTCLTIR